jgi:hypothetical protein
MSGMCGGRVARDRDHGKTRAIQHQALKADPADCDRIRF